MKQARRLAIGSLVGTLAFLASGCREGAVGAPSTDVAVPLAHGSVQAVIQQDTLAGDGTITFVVRVQSRDVTVSSFQGAVSFAPGAFTLVSMNAPPPQAGENFLLNPAGFTDGRIRFAALTTSRFVGTDVGDGVEAFRFTVRPLRPVAQSGIVATLDVVGTDVGKAISAEHVMASPGVQTVSRHLVK